MCYNAFIRSGFIKTELAPRQFAGKNKNQKGYKHVKAADDASSSCFNYGFCRVFLFFAQLKQK